MVLISTIRTRMDFAAPTAF
jgi:hypothetical protein